MTQSLPRRLFHSTALAGLVALPILATTAAPAAADWQRGRTWHGGGGCGGCAFIPGVAVGLGIATLAAAPYYYAPPPVYYAPRVYYAPPPPVYYYAPPAYYAYPRY